MKLREYADRLSGELERYGATGIHVAHGGEHPRLQFHYGGRDWFYVIPGSTGDRRAYRNSLSNLRRMIGVRHGKRAAREEQMDVAAEVGKAITNGAPATAMAAAAAAALASKAPSPAIATDAALAIWMQGDRQASLSIGESDLNYLFHGAERRTGRVIVVAIDDRTIAVERSDTDEGNARLNTHGASSVFRLKREVVQALNPAYGEGRHTFKCRRDRMDGKPSLVCELPAVPDVAPARVNRVRKRLADGTVKIYEYPARPKQAAPVPEQRAAPALPPSAAPPPDEDAKSRLKRAIEAVNILLDHVPEALLAVENNRLKARLRIVQEIDL